MRELGIHAVYLTAGDCHRRREPSQIGWLTSCFQTSRRVIDFHVRSKLTSDDQKQQYNLKARKDPVKTYIAVRIQEVIQRLL